MTLEKQVIEILENKNLFNTFTKRKYVDYWTGQWDVEMFLNDLEMAIYGKPDLIAESIPDEKYIYENFYNEKTGIAIVKDVEIKYELKCAEFLYVTCDVELSDWIYDEDYGWLYQGCGIRIKKVE